MTRFLWLRRMVRRSTAPIPYQKADRWRSRLSIVYAVIAWHLLGYIGLEFYRGRGTKESYGMEEDPMEKLSPAERRAISAKIEKAKIIRSTGITEFKLEDYAQYMEKNPVVEEEDEDNVA